MVFAFGDGYGSEMILAIPCSVLEINEAVWMVDVDGRSMVYYGFLFYGFPGVFLWLIQLVEY